MIHIWGVCSGVRLNTYGFISSIISSLVWPVVALVVLFVLKKPLSQLLLGLRNFKYSKLEMNFGKELSKLEQSFNNEPKTSEPKPELKMSYEKENEVKSVAEISPNSAMLIVWSMVEQEIAMAVNRLAISPDYPPHNSPLMNIVLLRDNGLIDSQTYETIEDIRQIRNKVAHTTERVPYFDAIKYYEIAVRLIAKLQQIKR